MQAEATQELRQNTSNERTLFSDVSAKEAMCSDPACWKQKTDAAWAKIAATAEEKGIEVVPEAKTKKLFPHGGRQLAHDSGYVNLDDTCYQDPKNRTYKQLLGKKAPVAVARDQDGGIHHLVPKAAVDAVLKDAGVKRGAAGADAADARARAAGKRRRAMTQAILGAIVEAAQRSPETGPLATAQEMMFLRVLVPTLRQCGMSDSCRELVSRRGIKEKGKRPDDILVKLIKANDASPSVLRGIAVELVLGRGAYFSYSDKVPQHIYDAAKIYDVDVPKVLADLAQQLALTKPGKIKMTSGGTPVGKLYAGKKKDKR